MLLFCAGLIFIFQVWSKKELYTKPYDYEYFADRYANSQYVLSEQAKYILPDDDLYSFAGYYYISGGQVSRVNFENPPLGKYLIGLSIVIFNNQRVIHLLYALLYLVVTYALGVVVFRHKTIAALGVLLLSLDPYLHQAMRMPMLDFPMSVFFLAGLLFFMRGKTLWRYALSSLFFGMSLSTKFFPFLFIALFCFFLYQVFERRRELRVFLITTPLIILIYLSTYTEFLLRSSFVDFVRYQWWVLRWRMGNPYVFGNMFRTIFTGTFKPWWQTSEKLHSYTAEWSLIIPILVGITIFSIVLFYKNKLFRYLYGFLWVFFAYANIATEGGLKYLAPFYPLFCVSTAAVVITVLAKLRFVKKEAK